MITNEFLDKLSNDHIQVAVFFFDVKHVKKYLFCTNKPLEVKGASVILDFFSNPSKYAKKMSNYEKYYRFSLDYILDKYLNSSFENWIIARDGGSGFFITPIEHSEDIKKELYNAFESLTINGEITISYIITEPAKLKKDFKSVFYQLQQAAKMETLSRQKKYIVSIPPFLHKCDSCGTNPAVKTEIKDKDKLCFSCQQKREICRLINKNDESFNTARTFLDLVRNTGTSQDNMAIIYSDANEMGVIFNEKVNYGIIKYSEFSYFLRKHIDDALEKTIESLSLQSKNISIALGGDDILIALPASNCIQFIKTLRQNLSINADKEITNIGYSFSMILTKSNFPIRFLMEYAGSLLKNAKKICYFEDPKNTPKPSFAIDYMVIKESSPLSHNIENLRNNLSNPDKTLQLTNKPYNWNGFNDLLIFTRNLREISIESKGQLGIIANSLANQCSEEAKMTIDYYYSKLNESNPSVNKIITDITIPSLYDSLVINSHGSPKKKTKFFDALELIDFIDNPKEKDM